MTKIEKKLKQLFKTIKKEKKRCAKEYPGWQDDCYNMLDARFVWALPSNPKETEPSFCSLNDAQIYFSRKTHKYYLDLDPIAIQAGAEEDAWVELDRLSRIESAFRDFLIENNMRLRASTVTLFYPDDQPILEGATLTELYTKLRILIEGYRWFIETDKNQQEN